MAQQPPLPEGIPWPAVTINWWEALGGSSSAESWTDLQWLSLLDTALCHADVWGGNLDRLGELRIRLSEFGFSPASADKLTERTAPKKQPSSTVDEFTQRRQERQAR